NLVAYSWSAAFLKPGDEVVITGMEHHSNIVPWQMACERHGAVLKVIPLQEDGSIRIEDAAALIGPRTKMVAVVYVSNALGTINPVKDIIALAHAQGAHVLLDAAQAVHHMSLDVQDLDCEFLAFSGHK